MNTGKILLGVLAGVAAGAALGILFAPEKGLVTRKKISKKGTDYVDAIKEKFSSFIDDVQNDVETVKDKANEFMENGIVKA
jgi:gas vesicle protein